ncbi:MAG: Translocation protein S62 [Vezdaea acicularis]|nr:MAG: Translocation protein S62 [Vezdaea acicularis]
MQAPSPGQMPTPQQIAAMQAQLALEAKKRGISVQAYVEQLKAQAMQQRAAQQAGGSIPGIQPHTHDHGPQQVQQQVPINPGPPNPSAIAVAAFLRSQDLKSRSCILNGQRKDMFKVKRALRSLQSPAYAAARKKTPDLPAVTDDASAETAFKLLPLSLLALRVSKADPHEGHAHAAGQAEKKPKKVKGLWTVKIEQQQDVSADLHYVWLYEGPQWKTKLYALAAISIILALVLFPLWPMKLRLGVWYLSMGMLFLVVAFLAMAVVRLILFVCSLGVCERGLWLYPNLFEDVGFFDSFRPVWGWQEEKTKKSKKAGKKSTSSKSDKNSHTTAASSGTAPPARTALSARDMKPRIEEVEDE